MFTTISDFEKAWGFESDSTLKILRALTDSSLSQAVTPEDRTLGRMAWHLVTTLPEMMGRTGLTVVGAPHDSPVPSSAKAIADSYEQASKSVLEQVTTKWTDATLKVEDDMYGEKWTRASTLAALIGHQTHHRAQMTVLMRQAGLKVPGVYGPAREDWSKMGAPPPEV